MSVSWRALLWADFLEQDRWTLYPSGIVVYLVLISADRDRNVSFTRQA
jgi:hypothetical protein